MAGFVKPDKVKITWLGAVRYELTEGMNDDTVSKREDGVHATVRAYEFTQPKLHFNYICWAGYAGTPTESGT